MEVLGAMRLRAKAKRCKASALGKSARSDEALYSSETQVYWRRDCVEVCWSYPWRPAGFRFGGRPYNVRRKADGPVDQGSTLSTVRRPKGRLNRGDIARGGKGSTAKVVDESRTRMSYQGRQPPRGGSRRTQLPSLLGCYRGPWRYRSHSTPAEILWRGTRSFMRAAICLTQNVL